MHGSELVFMVFDERGPKIAFSGAKIVNTMRKIPGNNQCPMSFIFKK